MAVEGLNYRQAFRHNLEPFLTMLANVRSEHSPKEWEAMVSRTRQAIIGNPNQYLGQELPSRREVVAIVDAIFLEFLDTISYS